MKVYQSLENGNLTDKYGGNNGTLTAGASRGFVTTERGLAMDFDGADTKIDISSVWDSFPIDNTPFTISAWVKSSKEDNQQEIVDIGKDSQYEGFRILIFNNNIYGQTMDGTTRYSITGTTNLNLNVWYYGTFTYDGSTRRIYLNGVEDNSPVTDGSWVISTEASIGYQNNELGFFSGSIQDVQIWNEVLTAQQVAKEYNDTKDRNNLAQTKRNFYYETTSDSDVLFIDNNNYAPADVITQSSSLGDYTIDSGTFRYSEDSTGKYIDCVTDGVISDSYDSESSTGNGWIKTATGELSADEGGTVDDSTYFAVSGNRLSITMTAGDKLRKLIITRAE